MADPDPNESTNPFLMAIERVANRKENTIETQHDENIRRLQVVHLEPVDIPEHDLAEGDRIDEAAGYAPTGDQEIWYAESPPPQAQQIEQQPMIQKGKTKGKRNMQTEEEVVQESILVTSQRFTSRLYETTTYSVEQAIEILISEASEGSTYLKEKLDCVHWSYMPYIHCEVHERMAKLNWASIIKMNVNEVLNVYRQHYDIASDIQFFIDTVYVLLYTDEEDYSDEDENYNTLPAPANAPSELGEPSGSGYAARR